MKGNKTGLRTFETLSDKKKWTDKEETAWQYGILKGKEIYKKKILEWHILVVEGLGNGLSNVLRDGRTEDINFWIRRSNLFNAFSHCIMDLITEQDYHFDEKDLKEISEEGYKL